MPKTLAVVLVLIAGATSCARPAPGRARDTASQRAATAPEASRAAPHSAPAAHDLPSEVQVALLDPALLGVLQARGFSLGELVSGAKAPTTHELGRLPAFESIFSVLRADVRAVKREQPLAQVTSTMGFRLFDERWFDSNEMSFALTGVFNRLDRRAFHPTSCGEVRFVYRLAYRTEQGREPMSSRLPMTVNVVYWVAPDATGCTSAARAWRLPAAGFPVFERNGGAGLDVESASAALLSQGPLSSERRALFRLKSVETNLQTFRLQSSVQTSLAGHIEYGLRVFKPLAGETLRFGPAPMENLPDVAALARDPELRRALLAYLKMPETLEAIDRGTLVIPERFLATSAISFSPRGLSRTANRPFRKLFAPLDFAGLALDRYRTIASPLALLRRLDGTSCTGCHQSRSIAGFHQVGFDTEGSPRASALVSGMSPHLGDELERRRAYVTAVLEGRAPDEFRPVPERQGVGRGEGAPCGLGDAGFRDWTCDPGFTCERLEDPEIGSCRAATEIGAACEYGELHSAARPARDRAALTRHACAASHTCWTNLSGFPLGACVSSCSSSGPNGVCSDLLDVDGYQECLRRKRPLSECQAEFVSRAGLRACDANNPCRQDYVCARTGASDLARGACVPPYFIFQLRLDGYPIRR